jgi:hypothetical protein
MGTYISITAHVIIKPENEGKAVQAVRDFNKRDDLKRGGGFSSGKMVSKWFSWCPENYEDLIHSIEDIFADVMLGFDVNKHVNSDGNFEYDMIYNDKWGQHELFFVAIAPFCEKLEVDHYCDELEYPNFNWKIKLDPVTKRIHQLEPEIIINYPKMGDDNVISYESFKPYSWV